MLQNILSIILTIVLIASIIYVIRKRKKAGITGFKTALTSICFFLIGVVNLLAYWFDFMGFWNWALTIILLMAGAYFTKFMRLSEKRT
ncbi:hypothetical protein LCM10_03980 [Rossellomorea aquimaris]|uniref:hypothetical protein n=1 Tax=Rossellomorea aquimaris TaxID=189382 RepID=UPI001CD77A82|nr:hypothetical protein [Rossellomorea aquimaris]MCA1054135.1 hypothetical protein [Rossellomorea aquimaris]